MNLEDILKISIIKTVRFNLHYFGWKKIVKPIVLCSREVSLKKMKGTVSVKNPVIFGVKIGFGNVGIIDSSRERAMWENSGNVDFQSRARLDTGTRIVCQKGAKLCFGENVRINGRTSIICYKKIVLGDECLLSWDNLLMDTDFHKIYDMNTDNNVPINDDREIELDSHVWVGCRCTILKGSYVPKNSVIAAGSIITSKLNSSNCLYIGNAEKKDSIRWES